MGESCTGCASIPCACESKIWNARLRSRDTGREGWVLGGAKSRRFILDQLAAYRSSAFDYGPIQRIYDTPHSFDAPGTVRINDPIRITSAAGARDSVLQSVTELLKAQGITDPKTGPGSDYYAIATEIGKALTPSESEAFTIESYGQRPHLAASWDGEKAQFYMNGVRVATTPLPPNEASPLPHVEALVLTKAELARALFDVSPAALAEVSRVADVPKEKALDIAWAGKDGKTPTLRGVRSHAEATAAAVFARRST